MRFHWTSESVGCNLCGLDDCAVLFSQDQHGFGLRTVMCRGCGLIYLNPRPSAADYDEFYRHWYHRLYPARAAFHAGHLGGRIAAASAHLRFQSYRSLIGEQSRLLEIGPGEGAFLSLLAARRPQSRSWGVDLSPAEVAACQRKGLAVVQGGIEALPAEYRDNTHIALFHVLEHALDPLAVLRAAAERLQPEGYIFVEVPNILGRWRGLGMLHIAHPYQFAPATLAGVLAAAGLQTVWMETLENPMFPSSLRAVARKAHGSLPEQTFSMPSVEEMRRLFAGKLRGWRRQLLAGRIKRGLSCWMGPQLTALIWEQTAGRQWQRILHSPGLVQGIALGR